MTAHNARKPLNQNSPAPTGIVALKEAARRWLCVVLEHAGWIGRELGLCLSPSYRPEAMLAKMTCQALKHVLRPIVGVPGPLDLNALRGFGVAPVSLLSGLSRSTLGEDFPRAVRWLWSMLERLPSDDLVDRAGLDDWVDRDWLDSSLVGDWWKAIDMLRGCLASTWAWMDDDFSDVEGLPEGIASIFKRGGFPELSDDELAELGAWLKTNASEVYHGLDRSNLAKAPRMEEAKKCLWAIYECNTTLRRAVAPGAGAGDTEQEPRAETVGLPQDDADDKKEVPPQPDSRCAPMNKTQIAARILNRTDVKNVRSRDISEMMGRCDLRCEGNGKWSIRLDPAVLSREAISRLEMPQWPPQQRA